MNEFKLNYQLDSKIDLASEVIRLELKSQTETLSRWVVNTRDESVRNSLVRMGWTPPEKKDQLGSVTAPRVWDVLQAARALDKIFFEGEYWAGYVPIRQKEYVTEACALHLALKNLLA